MKKKTIIFGCSGHAKVVIDALECVKGHEILGLLDSSGQEKGEWFGYTILGGDTSLEDIIQHEGPLQGIVAIGENHDRLKAVESIIQSCPGFTFISAIHPSANIAKSAMIGEGVFIAAGATVCANARLGDHVIVNTNASVDHDCVLEPFSSIGPNAALGGTVVVGEEAHVGLGASVLQGLSIGAHSILGAGAVAIRDVPENKVAVGVPAKSRVLKGFEKHSRMIVLFTRKNEDGARAEEIALDIFGDELIIHHGSWGEKFPEALLKENFKIILSFLSPWILPAAILNESEIALNFHPGSRDYPGIGCYNFALYEEAKIYGATCHYMLPQVDAGKILIERTFPVKNDDSVLTLKNKTMDEILSMFREVCIMLKNGEALPEAKVLWSRRPFTRKELNDLCKIKTDMSPEEVNKIIRSVTFPGHDGASVEIGGFKFVAVTEQ